MASGEEEICVQETGTPRTRSTRAVSVKKPARGRKKAAASPRATRSKRSTRSTQPAESEEEEEDTETLSESNQDTSENATSESVEENVAEDDHIADEKYVVSEDNIPGDGNIVKDDDKAEDENDSESGDEIQEEEGTRNEKGQIKHSEGRNENQQIKHSEEGNNREQTKHSEERSEKEQVRHSDEKGQIKHSEERNENEQIKHSEVDGKDEEQDSASSKAKSKPEPQEVTENNTSENGHDKSENDCQIKIKVEKNDDKETDAGIGKTGAGDGPKKLEATEDRVLKIKKENGEESDSSETAELKQEAKLEKKELEELNQPETGSLPEQIKSEENMSPVHTLKEKEVPEHMEVESDSKTIIKRETMEVDEDIIVKGTEEKSVKVEVKKEPSLQKKTKEKKVKIKEEIKKDENMMVVNEKEKEEGKEDERITVLNEKREYATVEKEIQDEDNSNNRTVEDDVENMTVIDEVTDESTVQEQMDKEDKPNVEGQSPFPTEPDTEMVSEDELPTESSKEPLETEAVSDEELPEPAVPVDLPETEAVSEDELPPEKVEKKKKKKAVAATKVTDSSGGTGTEGEVSKKKVRSTEAQKRKMIDGDTYDPSSPTSENSCDETPAAKRAAVSSATGGIQAKPVTKTRKALPELEKYWKAVKEDPSDFTGWTYLLQYVDQENDIEAAREAYDAFLSHYPYCYGYWRKYADYEKRKGNKEKCEEVFERGLKAIPLSVDLWIHFLNYSKATYPDDEEHLRTQFEKAISACGMEFRSDRLWESYIKWETEGKRLQNVTTLYDRLLAMPTQGYTNHFDNFQEHIASNPPQKVLSVDEFLTLRREVLQQLKQYDTPTTVDDAVPGEEVEAPPGEEPEEQPLVKTDEETTALRERIISIRRKVHKATVSAVADRWNFEEGIKRPYFHVKPLERCQLKNWKEYLDYEIEQGDQERIVVLFERCLIACALYEEFWIKFVRYLESIKGEDVTDKIRNVYERACTIHHTKKPNLHLHWAVFEESHKNYEKASEILNNLEKLIPNMLQVAYRRINLERRRNNMDKVCALYEHYISSTKNKVISNNMAIKYARFCWKVKVDVDKAIAILNKAVEKDKDNPRLYLQLIDMGLQKSPLNEEEIVSIIDMFLSRDTDPEQKVLFAQRKVEFLEDFGSDIISVQKAHDEFQRYFKQAKDRKKKSPDLDKSAENASSSKKAKSLSTVGDGTPLHSHTSPQTAHSATGQQAAQASATAAASASQYQATTYNQTGGYSQQAQAQGGYQGSQYPPAGPQQPPTPYSQPPYNQQYGQSSDPNYANYQNWGYSQTGYGGYNQGWGNYNYY